MRAHLYHSLARAQEEKCSQKIGARAVVLLSARLGLNKKRELV
jgi:hypothetical protein